MKNTQDNTRISFLKEQSANWLMVEQWLMLIDVVEWLLMHSMQFTLSKKFT